MNWRETEGGIECELKREKTKGEGETVRSRHRNSDGEKECGIKAKWTQRERTRP